MRNLLFLLLILTVFTSCDRIQDTLQRNKENQPKVVSPTPISFKPISVDYPATYRDSSVVDDYHGKRITDPYRWLEDDHSTDTKRWVQSQNAATEGYLAQIPFRDELEKRLSALWNYKRVSAPRKKGDRYYVFQNDGLQNQDILYAQTDLGGQQTEILNPNQFSADGTASLGDYAFSKDNDFLAYEISQGGSDWRTIRIKDLRTNQILDDELQWVKFNNISWAGSGFFYSRYPEPAAKDELAGVNEFHQVWYHRIGTPQVEDELVFADRAHPQRNIHTETTSDERFLTLRVTESTSGNALYFRDLQSDDDSFIPIDEKFAHDYFVVDSQKDKLLVLTNQGAPNWRLIQISTRYPAPEYWEEVIPATEDVLQEVQIFNNQIVATYIHNASSQIKVFTLQGGEIGEIKLPEIGTVQNIRGSRNDAQIFIEFASFTRPTTVYTSNLNSLDLNVLSEPNINFSSGNFITRQVWFKSYDGTKVPMFITHRKGLNLDGKRPTLLYGYGGFNISILPQFNLTRLNLGPIFLENDGIYAVPNLRGGGEFGADWHQAGTKENKQNVFNDFQAAAEYLIANNYTNSDKLAIYGRSNGGLLVGACMTQRPDLYKVALPAVGVLDMLRYHEFTIGWAWETDYGRSDDPKAFDYLVSYSPLHNITPLHYPATLVTTADHDDRVVPAHSFKFISELQQNQKGDTPTLIRVATNAGHGAGKSTQQKIAEAADVLGFAFYNLEEGVAELE